MFSLLIIILDLSEKIDDFIENQAPVKAVIFQFYLNYIPFLLNLFSPLFVFLAVIFFTSKMAQRSEVVAILAGGVSYARLLVPYIITASILAVFSFNLYAWIIPRADKSRMQFENAYVRERDNYARMKIKRQIRPGVIMTLDGFNLRDSLGFRLALEHIEGGELISKLTADKLMWNKRTQSWKIRKYRIREFDGEREYVEKGIEMDTMIPFEPEDFFIRKEDIQSFNMRELKAMVHAENMKGTGRAFLYETERHKRMASPFSIIILTVMGVSMSSKKSRGGMGSNLGIGLFISFLYLLVMQFFVAYGASGAMPAMLAAWTPNFIFSILAFGLYKLAHK